MPVCEDDGVPVAELDGVPVFVGLLDGVVPPVVVDELGTVPGVDCQDPPMHHVVAHPTRVGAPLCMGELAAVGVPLCAPSREPDIVATTRGSTQEHAQTSGVHHVVTRRTPLVACVRAAHSFGTLDEQQSCSPNEHVLE